MQKFLAYTAFWFFCLRLFEPGIVFVLYNHCNIWASIFLSKNFFEERLRSFGHDKRTSGCFVQRTVCIYRVPIVVFTVVKDAIDKYINRLCVENSFFKESPSVFFQIKLFAIIVVVWYNKISFFRFWSMIPNNNFCYRARTVQSCLTAEEVAGSFGFGRENRSVFACRERPYLICHYPNSLLVVLSADVL